MFRVVLVIALLSGAVASAEPAFSHPEAREHFARGVDLYTSKSYEAAIHEFELAFAIDPRPVILFTWAQAERLSGDCRSAVALYQKFIATNPPAKQAQAAEEKCALCQQTLAAMPAEPEPKVSPTVQLEPAPPVAAVAPAAPSVIDLRAETPPVPAPRWKKPLIVSVIVIGAAALVTGIAALAWAAQSPPDPTVGHSVVVGN